MKEKVIGTVIIIVVFSLIYLLTDKYYAIKIKRHEKKLDEIMSEDKYNEVIELLRKQGFPEDYII